MKKGKKNERHATIPRTRGEEALRDSEEQYRRLVENLGKEYFFYRHDRDGVFTYVSNSMTDMLGYSKQEFLTHHTEYHTDNSINKEAVKRTELSIQGQQQAPYEVEVYHKDRSILWLEVTEIPLRDYNGEVYAIEGIAKNITERKRHEERLNKINLGLLSLGSDYAKNIQVLTALAGELLGATCVLYNRLDGNLLCLIGKWNTPPNLLAEDNPSGHICFGLIQQKSKNVLIVRNLQESEYAKTDPNVIAYGLKTYVGYQVRIGGIIRGSLCVLYTVDYEPTDDDLFMLGILAAAVGQEEERKQAEEALLKLKKAVDNSREVIFMTDVEGAFTYINPEFTKMYGYEADEIVGKTTPKILKSGIFKREDYEQFWNSLLNKQSIYAQYVNKCKNGKLIDIEASADPILDDNGKIIGFLGIQRDITEQKRAKEALTSSEEKFRLLVENAPTGIYYVNLKGDFIYGNKVAEEIIGYKKEELIGKNFLTIGLLSFKDLAKATKLFALNVLGKSTGPDQFELIRKDGRQIQTEISTQIITIGGQKVVMGMVQDITERMRAGETLRESEDRYRDLVENSSDLVCTHDLDGNLLSVNKAAVKITGYSEKELLNMNMQNLIVPEYQRLFNAYLAEIKATGKAEGLMTVRTKTGERRIWEYNNTLRTQGIANPIVRGMSRDITERKRAEEELHRSNQELSVLHTIDRAVNQTLNLNQILNVAIEKTMEILKADSGGIYLLQEDGKTMKFVVHRGLSDEFVKNVETIQLGEGISGRAAAERKPIIIDVPHYPSKRLAPFIIKEGVQSLVSVPLLAKDRVLGAINVGSRKPDAFPENKIDTLLSIGIQIGVAIQNAEFFEEEQKKAKQLLAINKISQDIAGLMDVEKLMSRVVKLIHEIFGYSYVTLAVVDEKANEIVCKAAAGYNIAELKKRNEKLGGEGIIQWVALSGKHLLTNDVSKEPHFLYCDVLKQSRSELAVPIVVQNKIVAVLDVESDKLNAFNSDDLSTFETIAYDIGVALENARLYEELRGTTNYLENLITYANAPIIVWNLERKITIFNRAFEKLSGYRSDEVIGCDLEILFPSADKKEILKTIDQAIKGERWETVEIPIQRKDGERRIALWNSASIIDKDGNIIATIAQGQDITERKRAGEKLKESETKYRLLFESNPHPMWVYDLETLRFLTVNNAAVNKYGYSKEEFLSMTLKDIRPPEDIARLLKNVSESQEKIQSSGAWRHKLKDGTIIFVDIHSHSIEYDKKQARLVLAHDITERKRAEEELRIREAYLSAIIENQPGLIWLKNIESRFLAVNKAFAVSSGRQTSMDVIGKTDLDIWPRGLAEKYRTDDAHVMQTAQSISVEELIYDKGETKWFETFKTPVKDANGKIMGTTGYAHDITERKNAEKEIIMLANSLKSVNECVSITDMDDNIIFVNHSFLNTYGYSKKELVGKHMSIVRSQNNPPELVKEILPATIRGGWKGELWNRKKDGSEFPIYLSTTVINDKDGKPLGLIGVAKDITERKRAEEELIKAKEKAEQSDKLKTEFLAQMSHEIRSPMNVTLSMVNLIRDELDENLSSDLSSYFEGIDSAGKRLIRTVDLILNASEMQVGTYQPTWEDINLFKDVFNNLLAEYTTQAKMKSLNFNLVNRLSEPHIFADKYSVYQVFTNLIDNAIKYTNQGSVNVTIDNDAEQNVRVTISDTGIGMSKEFMSIMYEPFVQEDRGYTRRYEGNGLGLALVKKYCELNNASITVESEKGKGTVFTVIFKSH